MIQKLVDQILAGHDAWGVLLDVIEERGQQDEDWQMVVEELAIARANTISPVGLNFTEREMREFAFRQMFEGIAHVSYRYAVDLHLLWSDEKRTGDPYRSRDYGLQGAAIDGMNRARCGPDWEADLRREETEEVLREQGNMETKPLEYVELELVEHSVFPSTEVVVGDRIFVRHAEPSKHSLWLAFAPEYLESELQDEHGFDSEFLTLVTDGGGFQDEMPEFILVPNKEGDEVWEKAWEGAHGAEVQCPAADYDFETGTTEQDRKVTMEETYCGESPGRECRLCGTPIGEEHGFIYIGEGAEVVYRSIDEEEVDDE